MLTTWISDLAYMFRELGKDAGWYIFYWIFYNYKERVKYWNRIVQDCLLIADKISRKANDVVTIIEEWAKARYDWAKNQIGPLWDSFVAVWSRFGAAILDGAWTVVSWVEDKTTAVVQWVLSNYEEARKEAIAAYTWILEWGNNAALWFAEKSAEVWNWISTKAGSVWDWINTKAGTVWDWISTKAGLVWDWITKYSAWITTLFETGREQLAAFLDDPGRFIADWVVDTFEYIISECVFRFW